MTHCRRTEKDAKALDRYRRFIGSFVRAPADPDNCVDRHKSLDGKPGLLQALESWSRR